MKGVGHPPTQRAEKVNWMHENPVKRGLVGAPEAWRGSRCRFYLLGEAGTVAVNEGWGTISFLERIA